jgi:DNA polymerase-3 subunit delta
VVVRQADKGRRRAASAQRASGDDGEEETAEGSEEASLSTSFVSRNRQALEDYVARPSTSGVLVLEVNSWPSNTKLYKSIAANGLQVDCNAPAESTLLKWLRDRAASVYKANFAAGAAERLLEIVGPHMGGLDQETAKLALLAAPLADKKPVSDAPAVITPKLIDESVGGWRAKVAWDMIDAAAAGDAREALAQLDRLILAGEHPVALMGQIAWRFRQLAAAARIAVQAQTAGQRVNLRAALEQVGVKNWQGAMDKAEGNLRQLGARRAAQLYRWLLEADLALKGSSSSGDRARLVIEQLFARMSRQLAPATAGQTSPTR